MGGSFGTGQLQHDGGTTCVQRPCLQTATDGSNDQWHVDLGRFAEGTVIQYTVQATDSLTNSLTDTTTDRILCSCEYLIRECTPTRRGTIPAIRRQIFVNLVNANAATATGQVRVTIQPVVYIGPPISHPTHLGSGSGSTLTFAWRR